MQALLTAIGVSTKVAGGAAICAVILISPLAAIIALVSKSQALSIHTRSSHHVQGFAIDVLVKKNKYEQLRLQRDCILTLCLLTPFGLMRFFPPLDSKERRNSTSGYRVGELEQETGRLEAIQGIHG